MVKFIKKNKASAGFTLVELIVIVGIISLLTGLVFLMPRESIDIDLTARQMVSDLRWVQNAAMVGYYPPGIDKVTGFGIYTADDGTGYILFYSTDIDVVEYDGSASAIEFRRVNFPGGLTIEAGDGRDANVFYQPPDPKVFINGSEDTASIDFELEYKGEAVKIEVTNGGLIEY